MQLVDATRSRFPIEDRLRGETYFNRRTVQVVGVQSFGAATRVDGSQANPYRVVLSFGELGAGILGVRCSCPRYLDWGVCKHLWASIRTVAPQIGDLGEISAELHLKPLGLQRAAKIFSDLSRLAASPHERSPNPDGVEAILTMAGAEPDRQRRSGGKDPSWKSLEDNEVDGDYDYEEEEEDEDYDYDYDEDGDIDDDIDGDNDGDGEKLTWQKVGRSPRGGSSLWVGSPDRADEPLSNGASPQASDWSNRLLAWKRTLVQGRRRGDEACQNDLRSELFAQEQRFWFVIDLERQLVEDTLVLIPFLRKRKIDGEFGRPTKKSISRFEIDKLDDPLERKVISLLAGGGRSNPITYGGANSYRYASFSEFSLPAELAENVAPLLAESGRFGWSLSTDRSYGEFTPLGWDPGTAWRLELELLAVAGAPISSETQGSPRAARSRSLAKAHTSKAGLGESRSLPGLSGSGWRLHGTLVRGDARAPLNDVVLAVADGLAIVGNTLARVHPDDASWLKLLQREGPIVVPEEELDRFLGSLASCPALPTLRLPTEVGVETVRGVPRGRIEISSPKDRHERHLRAAVQLRYDEAVVQLADVSTSYWDESGRRFVSRDREAEIELLRGLEKYPLRPLQGWEAEPHLFQFSAEKLAEIVCGLGTEGWETVAEGKLIRQPGSLRISVSSGEDWFDLDGEIDFEGMSVELPQLLAAVRRKDQFVTLGDGTRGVLPVEWLTRYAGFAAAELLRGDAGESADEESGGPKLRFSRAQTLYLDALLSEQHADQVTLDKTFVRVRDRLRAFAGVKPLDAPRGFHGELRDYQREGLGWLKFLREFHLGGCLADDMGLGKTIQVLAMIQARKTRRLRGEEERRPTLVVVPKSLVFNWIDEAARFAPRLRVLNFTGIERRGFTTQWEDFDLIVTTYGTLRQDIEFLKDQHFDYAILDEAQAVKNSQSQAAKACRLLRADYRLVMTGTPVENHLGDLWSLMEFLNPGMLGRASVFQAVVKGGEQTPEALERIRRAVAPMVLRRTKDQVLRQLPKKTEQTLFCEMTPRQRDLYRELQDYYRLQLAKRVKKVGLQKAKIHVLEALLRLRQVACDPRLLDRGRNVPGAKLKQLVEQLAELRDEGHKTLVFSQFTSFLELLRSEVRRRKWDHEYLDGQTRDRASCVKRFQTEESCQLFLISLKAGGNGLNLTAADYVFILDPWWNPAVEAQAVDRAHRLGQQRPVTAYRIICQDTIEEKILALQERKRKLADAIISANESLLRNLTADDLQFLLS